MRYLTLSHHDNQNSTQLKRLIFLNQIEIDRSTQMSQILHFHNHVLLLAQRHLPSSFSYNELIRY